MNFADTAVIPGYLLRVNPRLAIKALLFFRRLCVVGFDEFLDYERSSNSVNCWLWEALSSMRERGLVCDDDDLVSTPSMSPEALDELFTGWRHQKFSEMSLNDPNIPQEHVVMAVLLSGDYLARMIAIRSDPSRNRIVPVTSPIFLHAEPPKQMIRSTVVRIVLSWLPFPDPVTPFEDILSFREEEETKRRLALLKNWMIRTSNTWQEGDSFFEDDLNDEIETTLREYSRYMEILGLKYYRSKLEIVLTSLSSAVENLAKLRLRQLVKDCFSIYNSHAGLLEAELKIPGRELSFIFHSRREFASQKAVTDNNA